eukprot:jgi/Galph1/3004/GphlegSOOS_G1675.1
MSLREGTLFESVGSAVQRAKEPRILSKYGSSSDFENPFVMPPSSMRETSPPLCDSRVEHLDFAALNSSLSRSSEASGMLPAESAAFEYLHNNLNAFDDRRGSLSWRRTVSRNNAWYGEHLKKGSFSKKEKELVDAGMIAVLQEEGLPYDLEFRRDFVTRKKNELPKKFWVRVAGHVPGRSAQSVYDHARRRLEPKNYKSFWSNEEVEELARLVKKYGTKWVQIGKELDRLPGACRDKWRDVLQTSGFRPQAVKRGRFTNEEEALLLSLVMQSRERHNGTIDWTEVANKMGTRSYRQCRRFYFNRATRSNFPSHSHNAESDFDLVESEVRWADLYTDRTREQTYDRWRLLVKKYVPEYYTQRNTENRMSFHECVRTLYNILKEKFQESRYISNSIGDC